MGHLTLTFRHTVFPNLTTRDAFAQLCRLAWHRKHKIHPYFPATFLKLCETSATHPPLQGGNTYVRKVSHNLMKVTGKYGVVPVFPAPCKLAQLCKRVMGSRVRKYCTRKHEYQYVSCATSVMCRIPSSSGRVYLGQTGQYLNDRLWQHFSCLKKEEVGSCLGLQMLRLLYVVEECGSCRPWRNKIRMRAFCSSVNWKLFSILDLIRELAWLWWHFKQRSAIHR